MPFNKSRTDCSLPQLAPSDISSCATNRKEKKRRAKKNGIQQKARIKPEPQVIILVHRKGPCKWTQHCHATIPNFVGCYMLHPFALPDACYCEFLRTVARSLELLKLLRQRLPTFLLFRDHWSVAQQCYICLRNSSNNVGATHAHKLIYIALTLCNRHAK